MASASTKRLKSAYRRVCTFIPMKNKRAAGPRQRRPGASSLKDWMRSIATLRGDRSDHARRWLSSKRGQA